MTRHDTWYQHDPLRLLEPEGGKQGCDKTASLVVLHIQLRQAVEGDQSNHSCGMLNLWPYTPGAPVCALPPNKVPTMRPMPVLMDEPSLSENTKHAASRVGLAPARLVIRGCQQSCHRAAMKPHINSGRPSRISGIHAKIDSLSSKFVVKAYAASQNTHQGYPSSQHSQ